jgi:hypothetical protein
MFMKASSFKLVGVLALGLIICLPGMALATVITFDDLPTPNSGDPNLGGGSVNSGYIPLLYEGFTWTVERRWGVVEDTTYNSAYHNNTAFPSSPNAAYNVDGITQIQMDTSSSGPINVIGAHFAYWALYDKTFQEQGYTFPHGLSSASVTVTGYLGSTLVGSVILSLTSEFQYLTLGFNNVDKLTFANDGNYRNYWLMDNLEYTPVPLPASVLLLGCGLLSLAGLGFRRKNS